MNACMGKDLTGEIAKSQAFLVFKSSYEFTAFTFVLALALALVLLAVIAADDEDEDLPVLPDAFPYNRYIIIHQHFHSFPFNSFGSVGTSETSEQTIHLFPRSPVPCADSTAPGSSRKESLCTAIDVPLTHRQILEGAEACSYNPRQPKKNQRKRGEK